MDRVKRIWYLSSMRAAKVQASLRIRAVSPEPLLLAHTSSESRGTFRQKARSLAPLNGWACAVKICHDGIVEDTNSLDGAHIISWKDIAYFVSWNKYKYPTQFILIIHLTEAPFFRVANIFNIFKLNNTCLRMPQADKSIASLLYRSRVAEYFKGIKFGCNLITSSPMGHLICHLKGDKWVN